MKRCDSATRTRHPSYIKALSPDHSETVEASKRLNSYKTDLSRLNILLDTVPALD